MKAWVCLRDAEGRQKSGGSENLVNRRGEGESLIQATAEGAKTDEQEVSWKVEKIHCKEGWGM